MLSHKFCQSTSSLPIKLKEEKHKIIKKLEEMQNCAQYRQKQESQSRNLKIQQLQKYEDEISLELIKIDIEISDMQGFNNSYINSLLAALHQKKESLRLKLIILFGGGTKKKQQADIK